MAERVQRNLSVRNVRVDDPFWTGIQALVTDVVIPYQADIFNDAVPGAEKSHAIENFRLAAGEAEGEFYGMVFQDSDVAKWLEAVAYALNLKPDAALERQADELIDLIGRAQEADGYLNTYFQVKEPQHKWQNLLECHELYCAGHMIEAAVAYYEATGKDALLKTMRKTADLICRRFGRGEGQVRGCPGHQEIELALLRLYRVTGERKYLQTAQYFLEERGTEPEYFAQEAGRRDWAHFGMDPANREYAQYHAPVKKQDKAVGHSVRAVYMYTAMADLAAETGDAELLAACDRLWENVTQKQMYITGGIGATVEGEAFTRDYDLPNDTIYAETCASIAMVFFARRMLELRPRGEYADIMEKELYNGALAGMQLDGKRFFYVNPLEVVPGVSGALHGYKHVLPERPGWYACACCPPNLARLVTSLGQYAWGEGEDTIYAHLYLGGRASFGCAGGVEVACESAYPWEGRVEYTLYPKGGQGFRFAVRIPGWATGWSLRVNGQPAEATVKEGYATLQREWTSGDVVTLELPIAPRRMYSSALVRENAGCVALMNGPVVYCFEEKDNGENLAALRVPRGAPLKAEWIQDAALGKLPVIRLEGRRALPGGRLYDDAPPTERPQQLTAVPYYMWGNRGPGGMRVWMPETE